MTSQVVTGPAPAAVEPPDAPRSRSRYRHPGDVVRLVLGSMVLLVAVVVAAIASDQLFGADSPTVRGAEPSSTGGHVVVGLVQVTVVIALLLAAVSQLRHRRFRLVATVAGAAGGGGGGVRGGSRPLRPGGAGGPGGPAGRGAGGGGG